MDGKKVCVYEGGFRGRVLQGTVGVLKCEYRDGRGFGRVGNHSLRVLCRLFLLPFHLSRLGVWGGGRGEASSSDQPLHHLLSTLEQK